MNWRGLKGVELAVWSIWLGSLWFMAVLVAPGLFKWLPRPEAGLVAGRLFYMLSCYSLFSCGLLLAVSALVSPVRSSLKWNALMAFLLIVTLVELVWLHPTMARMRQAMTGAPLAVVDDLRHQFAYMHGASSVMYAVKMIGGLVWGLGRFTVK